MNATLDPKRSAFRCIVMPENSAAILKAGHKPIPCRVLFTSRTGFSIRVPIKRKKLIDRSKRLVLHFAGEQWLVSVSSEFRDSRDDMTLGLDRVRELTRIKEPKSPLFILTPQFSPSSDPGFLFYLLLAFILACVCLPGIGDNLGTAPKVRDGLQDFFKSF